VKQQYFTDSNDDVEETTFCNQLSEDDGYNIVHEKVKMNRIILIID